MSNFKKKSNEKKELSFFKVSSLTVHRSENQKPKAQNFKKSNGMRGKRRKRGF